MAVAAELRASGAEVSFLGARGKIEAELVPEAGYEIDLLDVRGIDRRNPLRAASAMAKAAGAVGAARRALRERGADVVLGGGGYVSGAAGIAAALSRTPLVLTEADSHLGLSNRLLAGRARERFGISSAARCLLVMGGSQGARSINLAAVGAFAEGERAAAREFHVIHLSGERDHDEIARRLASAPHPERYTLIAYEPGLGDALAACDLVLARAGGSIFEVTAAGRPAILVPYPHATADHQWGNAEWMAGGGAAEIVDDAELDAGALAARVSGLFADDERLAEMSRASAALARPDAARRIADEVLAAAAVDPSGAPYVPVGSKRRTGT